MHDDALAAALVVCTTFHAPCAMSAAGCLLRTWQTALALLSAPHQIEDAKAKLEVVTALHVYSVQPGVPKVGPLLLVARHTAGAVLGGGASTAGSPAAARIALPSAQSCTSRRAAPPPSSLHNCNSLGLFNSSRALALWLAVPF